MNNRFVALEALGKKRQLVEGDMKNAAKRNNAIAKWI